LEPVAVYPACTKQQPEQQHDTNQFNTILEAA
jgi:hypothetical protein